MMTSTTTVGRPRTRSDEEILEAAAMVIGRVGPARLTLAAVAEAVGLSPAALVNRFRSKRRLMLALADVAAGAPDRTIADVRKELPEASSIAVLRRVLLRLGTAMGGADELANHCAFLQVDISDREFRERAVASMGALRRGVAELLDDAAARGEIVARDIEELADAIVSTWNGALITWAIFRDGPLDAWLAARLNAVIAPHLRQGLSQRRVSTPPPTERG